jgi:hypothetical protein
MKISINKVNLMKILIFFIISFSSILSQELENKTETPIKDENGVIHVRSGRSFTGINHMNDIEGTSIMAGKKNEVLDLTKLNANLTTNIFCIFSPSFCR